MLEPYAVKAASTVLRRGKFEITYLFQPQLYAKNKLCVYGVNFAKCHLVKVRLCIVSEQKPGQWRP